MGWLHRPGLHRLRDPHHASNKSDANLSKNKESASIQARGRTTILRLNYRNTAEMLAVAYEFAREELSPAEAEEDGIPPLRPESAGRHGKLPEIVRLPSFDGEVDYLVRAVRTFHAARQGRRGGGGAAPLRRDDAGDRPADRYLPRGIALRAAVDGGGAAGGLIGGPAPERRGA